MNNEFLTDSQREMMKDVYDKKTGLHPGMNTALCFQPLQQKYNFTSPALRNEEGKVVTDKEGNVARESSIAHLERLEYKKFCKEEYGAKWKTVFFHGNLPSLN